MTQPLFLLEQRFNGMIAPNIVRPRCPSALLQIHIATDLFLQSLFLNCFLGSSIRRKTKLDSVEYRGIKEIIRRRSCFYF